MSVTYIYLGRQSLQSPWSWFTVMSCLVSALWVEPEPCKEQYVLLIAMSSLQSLVLCFLNKKLSLIGTACVCMNVGQPLSKQTPKEDCPSQSSLYLPVACQIGLGPCELFPSSWWNFDLCSSHISMRSCAQWPCHCQKVTSLRLPPCPLAPTVFCLLFLSTLWVLGGSGGYLCDKRCPFMTKNSVTYSMFWQVMSLCINHCPLWEAFFFFLQSWGQHF